MQFEIKHEEYVNKTFRIKKELAERLSIAAADNNVSLNEFVVQSCEFALDNLKPKQDEKRGCKKTPLKEKSLRP